MAPSHQPLVTISASLRNLRALCVSVVTKRSSTLTTETQRTQRGAQRIAIRASTESGSGSFTLTLFVRQNCGEHCKTAANHHADTDPKISIIGSAMLNQNPKTTKHDKTQHQVYKVSQCLVPLCALRTFSRNREMDILSP